MANKIFLIGNLTKDPELTTTSSGVSACRFSIAVSRGYTDGNGERQTDFFNVTAWRGTGENIAKYTKKGSKILVIGSVQIRNYEDNQGNKRTTVDIIAQEVEFLGARPAGGENTGDVGGHASAPAAKRKPVLQAYDADDDIPF